MTEKRERQSPRTDQAWRDSVFHDALNGAKFAEDLETEVQALAEQNAELIRRLSERVAELERERRS